MNVVEMLNNYYKLDVTIGDLKIQKEMIEDEYGEICVKEDCENEMILLEKKIKDFEMEIKEKLVLKKRVENAINLLEERKQMYFYERFVARKTNEEIACKLYVDVTTVYRWRREIIDILEGMFNGE